jgi:hypothetical protein
MLALGCGGSGAPMGHGGEFDRPFQTHFGPVFCDEAVQTGLLFPEQGSIRVLLLALHRLAAT